MDPVVAQAMAALISAIATVVLMAGTFYFGSRRKKADEENADE